MGLRPEESKNPAKKKGSEKGRLWAAARGRRKKKKSPAESQRDLAREVGGERESEKKVRQS